MKKKVATITFIVILILLLAGCIPGDGVNIANKPAGFFWGIWHGWLGRLVCFST